MKINPSTKVILEFTDIEKGVPHPFTQGQHSAIVTRVVLTYEHFDLPQVDCDGEQVFFDYTFYGFQCKENGQRDGRQKRAGLVTFGRTQDTCRFILSLLSEEFDPKYADAVLFMRTQAQQMLDRANAREKEVIERMLKS